ncbi:MAG: SRPBCC domain-containing protein [Gemmatimonadota bacterium]
MNTMHTAYCSININAPAGRIWQALVTPTEIKEYMFGTTVVSDWKEGSPIVWKGDWKGKPYEDKGVLLQVKAEQLLQYTHFSPLAGLPDLAENYHTVTIELAADGARTGVTLSQDNNPTAEAREQSEKNWDTMLTALKQHVETGN